MATSVVTPSGGGITLQASYINKGDLPTYGPTIISSLEDADRFVNTRIGANGNFACCLGEEITINDGTYNAVWQVVGVDTELGKGDTPMTKHHIALVPKKYLTTSKIHNSSNRTGYNGYANSDMHTKTIPSIVSSLETILGDHLLERRVKLTNAVSSNTSPHEYMSSGNAYYSVRANLMCRAQVSGIVSYTYDTGDDIMQLPGFATGKVDNKVGEGSGYWLRDIYGDNAFYNNQYINAAVIGNSLSTGDAATKEYGVRPLITIG